MFLSIFFTLFSICLFAQVDNADCIDKVLPFFTAFDGFYVGDHCKFSEFGSYEFVVDRNSRSIKKEGVYREVWYHKKGDNNRHLSGPQILQNYSDALLKAGGEIVKESDGSVFKTNYNGKELWIYISANPFSEDLDNYGIISIEVDVMKQEITALDIKGTMDSQGKMALYGILFDTGNANIKPESENAIGTVAAFLKENPDLNIFIVGHTDNIGDYELNQKLSKSRGEAVKNHLISKYQISASRLTGTGVGPICPVTSNNTEEGKQLNRRVEIVRK